MCSAVKALYSISLSLPGQTLSVRRNPVTPTVLPEGEMTKLQEDFIYVHRYNDQVATNKMKIGKFLTVCWDYFLSVSLMDAHGHYQYCIYLVYLTKCREFYLLLVKNKQSHGQSWRQMSAEVIDQKIRKQHQRNPKKQLPKNQIVHGSFDGIKSSR